MPKTKVQYKLIPRGSPSAGVGNPWPAGEAWPASSFFWPASTITGIVFWPANTSLVMHLGPPVKNLARGPKRLPTPALHVNSHY